MTARDSSLGRDNFVAKHDLWTDAQAKAAEEVIRRVEKEKVEVVRLAYPDQHGIVRGKTVFAGDFKQVIRNGHGITTTLLAKDSSHKTVYPVFSKGGGFGMTEMQGAGDFIAVPDPSTFRVLPWAPDTGWVICDAYFQTGERMPFASRHILRDALERLERAGYRYVAGIEIEFHVFKLEDAHLHPESTGQPTKPPAISLLSHGYNYLTEQRFDQVEPLLQIIRRHAVAMGLPLRTVESEFGPTQVEFTFHPTEGLEPADNMLLFRNAVKQICRRYGYHATFMCQPGLPNLFASGWHLHQSLAHAKSGANAFVPEKDDDLLSPVGRNFVAGILEHARAASLFTTPTVNGYKRYKPNSLAPDRAVWGRDNKGSMVRSVGGAGDNGTRIENRVGDPAANPYLFLASQVYSGLDGIERKLEPPPPTEEPYETDAVQLPRNIIDAVRVLKEDTFFRKAMGEKFVDYITFLKEMEIERYLTTVTDWEHREYFDLF